MALGTLSNNMNIVEWIGSVLNGMDVNEHLFIAAGILALWLHKNEIVWERKKFQPLGISLMVCQVVQQWKERRNGNDKAHTDEIHTIWQPPDSS